MAIITSEHAFEAVARAQTKWCKPDTACTIQSSRPIHLPIKKHII